MRNGNYIIERGWMNGCYGSYRTYEEWKPRSSGSSYACISVLTVPMRNGNLTASAACQFVLGFLPYLWGMETHACPIVQGIFVRSYRTYEEWKPAVRGFIVLGIASSYRTYEEWKLRKSIYNIRFKLSSYRTYEEWKPSKHPFGQKFRQVLTVPMRNGNPVANENIISIY